jgi:hypothetical protein
MVMQGTAFVFINWEQAVHLGHVGWGFSLNEEQSLFYFGSTDHLYRHPWWDLPGWVRYAHVPARADGGIEDGGAYGAYIDWWGTTGSYDDMIRTMREGHHIRYHAASALPVQIARPERAVQCAEALAGAGWSVLKNNCVHQTYKVLSEYGASLPAPSLSWNNVIPKIWFTRLQGRQQLLV